MAFINQAVTVLQTLVIALGLHIKDNLYLINLLSLLFQKLSQKWIDFHHLSDGEEYVSHFSELLLLC